MAGAQTVQTVKQVEKVVLEDVSEVTGYVLELSPDEAQVIMDVIGGFVTGSSFTSRRKHANAIYDALISAGITFESPSDLKNNGAYLKFEAVL